MKKLKIENLQVKSFTTAVDKNQVKNLKGGSGADCSLPISCLAGVTVLGYSYCCTVDC